MQTQFRGPAPTLSRPEQRTLRDLQAVGTRHGGPAGALHFLIVEDDPLVRHACAQFGVESGCHVLTADTVPAARSLLTNKPIDLVLLDLKLPGGTGAELLREIRRHQPRAFVAMMTASPNSEFVVEVMNSGARDVLAKPFALERLARVLEQARLHRQGAEPSRVLQDKLEAGIAAGELLGRSPAMEKVFRMISKAALARHPVLIQGESGTGKEIVARAIHGNGPRAASPFVPVDCGSLLPAMLEAELFGSADPAAGSSKVGLLVKAGEGTIFFDEIAQLAPSLQARLLRALDTRQLTPLGSLRSVPFQARILASTSRNLQGMTDTGKFRKDLLARLNIMKVEVPPLRDREDDVLLLTECFLEIQRREFGTAFTLAEDALRLVREYPWAGNVRELESTIERACAMSSGPVVHLADLSTQVQAFEQATEAPPKEPVPRGETQVGLRTLREREMEAIRDVLDSYKGDKLLASRSLGIGKTTLYRKLKEYGLGAQSDE